jgi:hypothetical protein
MAILGAIGSTAFAVQAAGLGKPPPAELDLTQTMHWLDKYTVSHATIALRGRSYDATCRDSWLGNWRISDVQLGNGKSIFAVQGKIVDNTPVAYAEFQLAGCPLRLSKRMARPLVNGVPMSTSTGVRLGRAVYIVRVPEKHPQFELVISQKTKLPLELGLLGRVSGTSELTFGTRR